jgi:transposase
VDINIPYLSFTLNSFAMQHLTLEERVEIVLLCGREGISNRGVANVFNELHPERTVSHQAVGMLLNKFKLTGSVKDKEKKRRTAIVGNEEQSTMILAKFSVSPTKSLRRTSEEIGISKSVIHRVLQANKWHPYKIQLLQKLNEDDPDRRLEFCDWALQQYHADRLFPFTILFSDEANFYINGEVNKQNTRYWSSENPHWMEATKEQGCAKVMVWCGIWDSKIIGPFFFDATVNGENYLHMLQHEMMRMLQAAGNHLPIWFQQDGAPPHYATAVRNWLNVQFPDRWIGRRGAVEWPARSPDLNPCDFYLWGHLKALVYSEKVRDLNHLKERITDCCHEITEKTLNDVTRNWCERLQLCFDIGGEHFEHL